MNRRRFVVTSLAAAAGSAALATDACSSSSSFNPGPAPVPPIPGPSYTLDVRYAVTNFGGRYRLRTRTYGGKTVGPMMECRPGDTLSIKVVNALPPEPAAEAPRGSVMIPDVRTAMEAMSPTYRGPLVPSNAIDRMNDPHGFNTTNLHVHGIQTIPHLFDPVGTSNVMAPMIEIAPKQSFQYHFPIPGDQPSGLYWYHPHKHGSTDVQVSGGMAGLIVVRGPIDEVPEIAAAREIFLTIQTLNVNKSTTTPGLYEREYAAYKTPNQGGYNFGTSYTMLTVNGQGVAWLDNTTTPSQVTPLGVPQFAMRPGEVVRLRILNGCNDGPLPLVLPGLESYLIGFDGVNLAAPVKADLSGKGTTTVTAATMFTAPAFLILPANRLEMLVRAPKTPGTYTLASLATDGVDFEPTPRYELATFVVSGPEVAMTIPKTLPLPTREYPGITDAEIVARRRFVFAEGPNRNLLTGFGFTINDQLYDMMSSPTSPQLGTAEEWRIENTATESHPFHLHVNSFQLYAIDDKPLDRVEIWDTFVIPPKQNGKNGSITIRIRFLQWVGKTVFHCHILPHEDTGMMQNFTIV